MGCCLLEWEVDDATTKSIKQDYKIQTNFKTSFIMSVRMEEDVRK